MIDKSKTIKKPFRLLPWRSYDQMVADDNIPPRGTCERTLYIMAESYMRGLTLGFIGTFLIVLAFFAWRYFNE